MNGEKLRGRWKYWERVRLIRVRVKVGIIKVNMRGCKTLTEMKGMIIMIFIFRSGEC